MLQRRGGSSASKDHVQDLTREGQRKAVKPNPESSPRKDCYKHHVGIRSEFGIFATG